MAVADSDRMDEHADRANKFAWRRGDLVVQYPADAGDSASKPTGEQADGIPAGFDIGTSAEDDGVIGVNPGLMSDQVETFCRSSSR